MCISQMPAQDAADHIAAVAESYSAISGWLAGIAAAGIVVYLARDSLDKLTGSDTKDATSGTDNGAVTSVTADSPAGQLPIQPYQVVGALFFSMSALAICAFLYSSVTDDTKVESIATAMMIYGMVLGTSVLSLFYASH
jgi:hypothetical protein